MKQAKFEFIPTKYVVDFIESQGIRGKELLEEGNVKKLITLFKAFKINNISQWKASTSENLEEILNSFGLELKSTSSLKLSTKLKKLEGLGLENNLEKASTKISVMKEHVEDLSELSKEEKQAARAARKARYAAYQTRKQGRGGRRGGRRGRRSN